MSESIYERYSSYEKEKIFQILLHPDDYQPQAIETAKRIVKEKNWVAEYRALQETAQQEAEEENREWEQDISEKAAHYKKAVDFQKQKNSFQVRTSDMAKLESALIRNNIDFYREDKHVGVQLDSFPTQTYYFKDADIAEVDRITKETGLRAATYVDHQPFFKFEIKTLIIVLVVIAVIIYFLS